MRVLVAGAGAIGGYFGGRPLEAGRDVNEPDGSTSPILKGSTGSPLQCAFPWIDGAIMKLPIPSPKNSLHASPAPSATTIP
jgi:hypothetical protein